MKVASEQESKIDLSLKFAFASAPVGYGGPVATDEFFVLHGYGHVEGSQKLCPGVFIGGSQELLDVVRTNEIDPRNTLFLQGHTSWVPGQLNRELEKGVWYVASVSSSMILRYAGAPQSQPQAADYFSKGQNLWGDILHAMGGKWRDIEKEHCKANDWGK
jgi:putative transcriptional regulator